MPEHRWNDPRPFVVGPDDARAAFVLVHGFTGAPTEVRPLADALAMRGYRAIGPLLPGHGTDEDELGDVEWSEWFTTVVDALHWARESAEVVSLAGLSMGALLSTVVAARRPELVDTLGLLAPAFEVDNPLFRFVGLGRFVLDKMPAPRLPKAGLTSPDGWKRLWHYDNRPVDAVWQLRRLQKTAWSELPDVTMPTVVIQGLRDQTLVADGAKPAFERLGARQKSLVWLEKSGHCLTVDVELDRVVDALDELAVQRTFASK